MKQDTSAQQPPEISADKLGALFGVTKPAPSSGGLPNPAAMPKMMSSNNKVQISNNSSEMMKNKVNGLFAKPKRNMMMIEKDFKEDEEEYGNEVVQQPI